MSIKILLRDFRSVVKDGCVVNFNIGTTAHGPGVATMLERELPGCEICFWASAPLSAPLEQMVKRRFPKCRLVWGALDGTSPDVEEAVRWCDLLLIGSGTHIAVPKDVEAFARFSGKPYGAAGIGYAPQDLDVLQKSAFMFFRDSLALQQAKDAALNVPTGFVPDGVFDFDASNDAGAKAFMEQYGLKAGKFACCLPRYRITPRWEFIPGTPFPEERIAYNKRMLSQDMAPLVEAATRLVRQTHWKVLLSPETEPAIRLCQNELMAMFPNDVRQFIIVPETFWEADLALEVYKQSCGLFGTEMHSQVMAVGNGVPAMVCRTVEFGSKSQMWRDIGLNDWLFDFDSTNDRERFPDAVLQMFTQRERTAKLVENARKIIRERFGFFAEFMKQRFA